MKRNIASFFFSSRRRHTRLQGDWSSDVCSSDLSPTSGEKFSPPNLPVAVRDWAGNEISRIYSDQHGIFNGLTFSTFAVNPPDPSGYIPNVLDMCMNDRGTGVAPDPFYQSAYSQFCYEWTFMPGQTSYLDTPVIPTAAFAAEYNHPDCAYPDATPAISQVDGDGVGPWVSAGGHTITIHALGDQAVNNYGYSGPASTAPPFNQKTVTRHYGFGPAPAGGCSNGNANAACPSVTVGGIPLHGVSWSDTTITGTVQANVPLCGIQQRAQYGGSSARCGELVITAANGKQSVDTVTVTIGGKAPTHVLASGSIQSAIDHAAPGDLIIVDPTCTTTTGAAVACTTAGAIRSATTHNEILLMWKPVRLQGVGGASSIINANTHPAGKLDVWRRQVNCLMGLSLNGTPSGWTPACGSGWNAFTATPLNPQIDRLPLEAIIGWDAGLNGNLAAMLQEPTLMGAL